MEKRPKYATNLNRSFLPQRENLSLPGIIECFTPPLSFNSEQIFKFFKIKTQSALNTNFWQTFCIDSRIKME